MRAGQKAVRGLSCRNLGSQMIAKTWMRYFTISVLMLAFVVAPTTNARADRDGERLLDGLRQRRLFSLAEAYCRQQLDGQELGTGERAQLTIELIRTHAAHAIHSSPEQRQPYWDQAHEAAREFIRKDGRNPRLVLVQVQQGLTYLAQGQLVRQELEAGAAASGARERALAELRNASKVFRQVDEELTSAIRKSSNSATDDRLSTQELFALQNNVQYHLARTYRNRALCYDAGTDDRIDSLTRVMEQHGDLLRRVAENDPLRWEIQIERIVCQRLLGKYRDATRDLTALAAVPTSAKTQLRIRAEAVRLELASGRPRVALTVLGQGREVEGQVSPELDFAHLEVFDVLAREPGENEQAQADWQKKSLGMARIIEEIHGPYWARRANLLLVRSAGRGGGSHDLEILVRVADEFYVKGELDEAIGAYDKAAEKARSVKDVAGAFALAYKAGLVEHSRQSHQSASARLRDLAVTMAEHPKAANAHLLAIWNTSQRAAKDDSVLPFYSRLLEEHLANWPEGLSADKVREWLARLRESEQVWSEAIDIYLEVSATSERFNEAVEAAARCASRYCAELDSGDEQLDEQVGFTAQRFEDLLRDEQGKYPSQWSTAQRTAALTAARIRLQFGKRQHVQAAAILEAALKGSPAAPKAWQTEMRSLLVVALAGQPARRQAASDMLKSVADGSPQQLLAVLDGLTAIADAALPTAKVEIARLQLTAIQSFPAGQLKLTAAETTRFQRIKAEALASAGQRDEAVELYKRLADENPRSGRIQEGYAALLLDAKDPAMLKRALDRWRSVAQGSRPNTPRWYRAKYSIALAQFRLGDKATTARLIKYLQVTPPGLGATSLKADFERLLIRCQQ